MKLSQAKHALHQPHYIAGRIAKLVNKLGYKLKGTGLILALTMKDAQFK
jgi:hypothetical protein